MRSLGKRLLREQLEIRLQNKTGIQKELQKNIKTCASELGIDVPKAPVGLTQGAQKVDEEFDAHSAPERIEKPTRIPQNV